MDEEGSIVVSYIYDAWGNILYTTGSMATTLGTLNPLRYRGYVYDTETGLYYLQSRYYDPEIGRWINADNYPTTGQGLTGNNMFAYCGNNPVNMADPNGCWALALAGGGYLATLGTVGATNAWNPLGWVALGVVAVAAVIVIVDAVDDFAVTAEADDSNKGGRTTSPIGRRNTFNTRKKAYEAAKRAGGGKEPRHDPNGHDDDNRAHFHPNVSNQYRRTPKGVSMHDHYYYPR